MFLPFFFPKRRKNELARGKNRLRSVFRFKEVAATSSYWIAQDWKSAYANAMRW